MIDVLISIMTSAFQGFDTMLKAAVDVLADTDGVFIVNWNTVLAITEKLKPFCYIVIGICLLLEIAQVASKVDIIKWEHGLKLCVKMVLAKVCIDIAPTFLQACYMQAQDWITSIGSSDITFGTKAMDQLTPLLKEVDGFFVTLGLFVSTFVVIMAVKVCGLLIEVIAYGRMFELYVHLAVSPLPCAFMPLGTGDGIAVSRITGKFFKSFIAVCLQGVMMIVVIQLFNVVLGTTISDMIDSVAKGSEANEVITDLIYTMLLGSIALVMSVLKCGSWAKSIMDAM